jgi:signal transduction histidine kinase
VRRRLALLSLATTALVVVSLLVPLGLLVRRQAADRARVQAEREAQSTAGLIGLAVTFEGTSDTIESAVGTLEQGHIVVLSDGTVFGDPHQGQGSLVASAFEHQATITQLVDGGWEVALPVIGREGTAVVDVFVTDDELTQGVAEALALLALLGIVLIGAAVWVADRLGASLVLPIRGLAEAAHRMSGGDLEARAEPEEPAEVREVAEAFNQLAERLDQLLIDEREAVADLSHRLRTPLTSLRLQVEKIEDPGDRAEVLTQVDRLEQSIDQLIVATRAGSPDAGKCVLDAVVKERTAFWRVLAEEQGRQLTVGPDANGVELGMAQESLDAVVDTLIGNVFAHTPSGTAFAVRTGETDHSPWLEVSDRGPGFHDGSLVGRGRSGGGSTGLGLDIVRRTAELTGGKMEVWNQARGGAVVRVWFG